MPLFTLTCRITVSATTIVDSDTLENAIAEASDRGCVLHFVGSGTDPNEDWCVDEIDGEPENITAAGA
jgi:hypothetical protein